MAWKKIGVIFRPSGKLKWMKDYASVPFSEPLRGGLHRIYFSSRDAQDRSHVGYVEVDMEKPLEVRKVSKKPVLSPGPLGTFDEDGAMLSWITPNRNKKFLYYIGWNLAAHVPFRNSIGLAIGSPSGSDFTKVQGPILDRSTYDPCFVASSCVLREKNIWRMWYLSCFRWGLAGGAVRHWYHIKYAESRDGVHWKRDGKVCIDFRDSREYAISRPSVLKENGLYRMWYSYRGEKYRIGYAESADGVKWVRKDGKYGLEPSPSGWDSQMVEYPHVFIHKGRHYMLYNGNGYGKTGFGIAVWEDKERGSRSHGAGRRG